jgi:ADP-ribose pyrophosphatase YjhB (NUDIX family)
MCGASPLTHRGVGGRDRAACPRCGWVHYVNPIPGVGLVIEAEGGVVLIRRAHPPHKDEWALPSGYIEADETVEEAAVREAEEETGLIVRLTHLAAVNPFPEGPPQSGIMIFYTAEPVGGTLRAGDDASEARIFLPGQLPLLPFRTHREMLADWQMMRFGTPRFTVRRAVAADAREIAGLMAMRSPYRLLPREERRAAFERLRAEAALNAWVVVAEQTPPLLVGMRMETADGAWSAVMSAFRDTEVPALLDALSSETR